MGRLLTFLAVCFTFCQSKASVWTCPTGAWAEVNSNIVNRVVNGDTVTLPSGTNHYITAVTNTPTPKNFILMGVGTQRTVVQGTTVPTTNTLALTSSPVTAIVCDNTSGGIMDFGSVSNSLGVRVTGIMFLPGTNVPPDQSQGMIAIRGSNDRFRIDHCEFLTCGQSDIYIHDWARGCIDHNVFLDSGNNLSITVDHGSWNNADTGHGSWADNNSLGTTNSVYIEYNIATNNYSTSGILDGDLGGRAVVRYNTTSNLPPVTTHGTDTGLRSFRQLEYYGNVGVWDTNASGGFGGSKYAWDRHLYSRGGVVIAYSNMSIGFGNLCTLSAYRDMLGTWWVPGCGLRPANGTNTWDTNSPTIYINSTVAGASANETLVDNTQSWTVNQWAGFTVQNLTRNTACVISANTATTLNVSGHGTDGLGGGINTNIVFANGDSYRIYYVDHAMDQAGLGKGDLLSGNPPLNVTQGSIVAWPREISEKCYEWNNTMLYFQLQQSWLGHAVNNFFTVQTGTIRTNTDYIDGISMPGYTPLGQHPLDIISDPAIITQPSDQTVIAPATATFTCAFSGATWPGTIQWYKNAVAIGGATSATYTTPATSVTDNGTQFYAIGTDSGGSAQTITAILHVSTVTSNRKSMFNIGEGKLTLGNGKLVIGQ